MKQDFKHLKVIEIASVLAGPSVGLFFAEMGAKVTKIENKKTGGDITRSWKLPSEDKNAKVSAYFSSVNWQKESIFMDLTDSEDQAELGALIKTADVIIVNFKNRDAEKFKLDYPTLKAINQNLIYGEITGFGSENDRVAYDLILQAESGFMSMNGTPNSGPVKMPVALIDLLAGHQLKAGILTALYNRDCKKEGGSCVSVSLYDSAISSLANQATNWLMGKHIPERIGSTHPNIAPYGELFTSKDKVTLTFAIGSDKQFNKLCSVLGIEELADHPNFINNQVRVENRLSLASYLQDVIGHFKAAYIEEAMSQNFVPVARIKNLKEVFASKEAQGLVLKEMIDDVETKRVKTAVFDIRK